MKFISERVEARGIISDFVWCKGESRTCINIWDEANHEQTEFLEPGFSVTQEDCQRLIDKFREIVPNITGKLVTQIMLSIPAAVFLEAFLSFVGLGMPPGTCSLGTMLTDGFQNVLLHPYKLLPSAAIMIMLMVASHLVAEGMKKATE